MHVSYHSQKAQFLQQALSVVNYSLLQMYPDDNFSEPVIFSEAYTTDFRFSVGAYRLKATYTHTHPHTTNKRNRER